MRITRLLLLVGVCGFVLAAALLAPLRAQQGAAAGVTVDADDIGGVVTSANGPEAGVWVIAETDDLSTPLKKIVVTDDEGRYLLPDMPEATYRVWVRGYGLVDSEPVNGAPGDTVALTAVLAPDAQAAAQSSTIAFSSSSKTAMPSSRACFRWKRTIRERRCSPY
jgi:hypothetical protein